MQEQAVGSANLLAGVEADAMDLCTLELRLDEPRPYALDLFAQMPFFPWPRHRVEALGDAWRETVPRVGNGPFVLAETRDDYALLTANPEWGGSRGNVAEVRLDFRPLEDAVEGWRSGRFDLLMETSLGPTLADGSTTIGLPVPLPGTGYLAFNPRRGPLGDERVRRALAHGLDRARVIHGSRSQPALGGMIPPAMPGHSHDLALPFDIDQARTLLAEAGYPDGRGLPELRLLHTSFGDAGPSRNDREARWQQWTELGVRVRQEWFEWTQPVDYGGLAEADLFEWQWNADYPDPDGMLGTLLETTPIFRNAETDRLLARARSLHSRDERLELYRQADRQLVAEHVFVVPAYYDSIEFLRRPQLDGIWTSPVAISPLSDIVVRDR